MSNQNNQQSLSPEKYIRTRARTLPIGACFINQTWNESGMALIFVSRRHINGHITHAAYIVDMYCLGLKESFWTFNQDAHDFKEFIEQKQYENPYGMHLIKTDYVLAHNIIYGAIEYAGEFGFLPHKSFETSRYVLEEDDDHVPLIDLTFGFKGKPLYISSPERPAEKNRTLAQLEKNPGRGNYDFISEAEAPEFFENEEKKEREKANYHDPEVKRDIISDFLAHAEDPEKFQLNKAEELRHFFELSDTIFYEYMVTGEEMDKVSETIAGLFDFSISDAFFSDEMLFGKSPAPVNPGEIRKQAEKLFILSAEGRTNEGLKQSKVMMERYPEFPIFTYLYMRLREQKEGPGRQLAKLEKYIMQYPDYIPLKYMHEVFFLLNKPEYISRITFDTLHLKNFYQGRKTFCKEEVLLYLHLLTLNYSYAGEFAMVEEINDFFNINFPGILSENQMFATKTMKIPDVLRWCRTWMEKPD